MKGDIEQEISRWILQKRGKGCHGNWKRMVNLSSSKGWISRESLGKTSLMNGNLAETWRGDGLFVVLEARECPQRISTVVVQVQKGKCNMRQTRTWVGLKTIVKMLVLFKESYLRILRRGEAEIKNIIRVVFWKIILNFEIVKNLKKWYRVCSCTFQLVFPNDNMLHSHSTV